VVSSTALTPDSLSVKPAACTSRLPALTRDSVTPLALAATVMLPITALVPTMVTPASSAPMVTLPCVPRTMTTSPAPRSSWSSSACRLVPAAASATKVRPMALPMPRTKMSGWPPMASCQATTVRPCASVATASSLARPPVAESPRPLASPSTSSTKCVPSKRRAYSAVVEPSAGVRIHSSRRASPPAVSIGRDAVSCP
jgi:hypothetical protein